MIVRELVTKLGFKVDPKGLDKARQSLESFKSRAKLAGAAIAVGLSGIGYAAVKTASDIEQLTTSFGVLLGSQDKATALLGDLRKTAATTPFELTDLAQASQTLLAFGISADKILPTIQMLGDASLGNKQKFASMALVFAQIQSTGRLMGQDLLQLVNQGFNPLQIISEKTGESMASLKKRMENGEISAEAVTAAFKVATSAGGRFFQGMEKQSKTFEGRLSTFKDTLKEVLLTIGNTILPVAKRVLDQLIVLVEGPLMQFIKANEKSLQNFFAQFGQFVLEAIPYLIAFSKVLIQVFSFILNNMPAIISIFSMLAALKIGLMFHAWAVGLTSFLALQPQIALMAAAIVAIGFAVQSVYKVFKEKEQHKQLMDNLAIQQRIADLRLQSVKDQKELNALEQSGEGESRKARLLKARLNAANQTMEQKKSELKATQDPFAVPDFKAQMDAAGRNIQMDVQRGVTQNSKNVNVNNDVKIDVNLPEGKQGQSPMSLSDFGIGASKVMQEAARSVFSMELQKMVIATM